MLQPRCVFDESKIAELAESIRSIGLLQPLLVRKLSDRFEIIAGERRFRAASRVGLKALPCTIMDVDDERAMTMALVENVQREDLNPIEQARGYLRLKQLVGMSQDDIARQIGKDRTTVANMLRLLNLPLPVQDLLVSQEISMGHARALLSLASSDMMIMIAKKAGREGMSVRRLEGLVRAIRCGNGESSLCASGAEGAQPKAIEREIQQKLEYALGVRVSLNRQGDGYALGIRFSGIDELNDFLMRLEIEI